MAWLQATLGSRASTTDVCKELARCLVYLSVLMSMKTSHRTCLYIGHVSTTCTQFYPRSILI